MADRCPEKTMRQHVPDEKGQRCIVCGQWLCGGVEQQECPGISEDDVPEAFTHDPDQVASGNLLCPVCLCRPCLHTCRLRFTRQDLEDLNGRW